MAVTDYDYVIIGGSSAGCALAARLTENPSVSVLLAEAGASKGGLLDFWKIEMPAAFEKAWVDPKYIGASTAQAYIRPNIGRNLTVTDCSHARHLTYEGNPVSGLAYYSRRHRPGSARNARSHPFCRLDQFAPAPHDFGHRSGRTPQRDRYRL